MIFRCFRLLTVFILPVLLPFMAIAQQNDLGQVTLPSPNNVFASSSFENDVNFYSGVSQVLLPIFTMKSKELSQPINLQYTATGIRLQDYAGVVGLGWNLNASGIITRTVRGLPDESEKGYIGKNMTGANINAGTEIDYNKSDKVAKGEWDGEPDLFFLKTPTENVSFVFNENKEPIFNKPTKLKVWFTRVNGENDNLAIVFYAIDENGIRYTFGEYADSRETVEGTPEFVSTWYLSKMNSFNKTDEITYYYTAGPDIVTYYHFKGRSIVNTQGQCSATNIAWANDNKRTYKSPKYLTRMTSAAGEVKFTYGSNRKDLGGAWQLLGIETYNEYSPLSRRRFRFMYDYFGDIPTSVNPDAHRLALRSVYEYSQNDQHSTRLFEFDYYNNPSNKFPARTSVATDYLGFYNNNSESTPFVPEANKTPDFSKTVQYSLKSIVVNRGGKTEYEYELNSYYDASASANVVAPGIRLKSTRTFDQVGNSYLRSYEYKLANGNSSGQIRLQTPTYSQITGILYPFPGAACLAEFTNTISTSRYSLTDLSGIYSGYSRVKIIDANGGYEVRQFTNFDMFPDVERVYEVNSAIPANSMRQFGFPTSYAYKRGLLKSVELFTNTNQQISETKYEYSSIKAHEIKARGISVSHRLIIGGATTGTQYYTNVYYQPTEAYNVSRETEKVFDKDFPTRFILKTKDFEYNTSGTLVRRITHSASNGGSVATKFYYPENAAEITGLSANEYNALDSLKMLTTAFREEKYEGTLLLHSKHTRYELFEPATDHSKIYPVSIMISRTGSTPIEELSLSYDIPVGPVKTTVSRTGIVTGYLWSREARLIARSTNATGDEIFYASFEERASSPQDNPHSGQRYFQGSYFVPFIRPNAKNYFLTYWRRVNNVWELVKQNLTTDQPVINEPYPIDDVKVFPEGAILNTYTHIPMGGELSFTDGNENLQTYEYDPFKRLKLIRDHKGNILKQLEYKDACDCPVPVPLARIEIRNQWWDAQPGADVLFGDVYLVLRESDGLLSDLQGVTVNYETRISSSSGNQNTTSTKVINNGEVLIHSGPIDETFLDPGSLTPIGYNVLNFVVLPGIGYTILTTP